MAQLPGFDEKITLQKLMRLSPMARVIFALAVATRLLPSYGRFHAKTGKGDAVLLENLNEMLWMDVSYPGHMNPDDLKAAAAKALAAVPSEEEGWDQETQAYAEDAASAVAYAYRARLNEKPEEAAWAAQCAFETIEYFIEQQPIKELSLESFLIQAELDRQERDMRDLEAWEKSGLDPARATELKTRSEREAAAVIQQSLP